MVIFNGPADYGDASGSFSLEASRLAQREGSAAAREFSLSQVKGMDAWRGNLVHEAHSVVRLPSFEATSGRSMERVIEEAR